MVHQILTIADDLTGAADTGHEFASRGYKTILCLDPGYEPPDSSVVVVDTDSRYTSATQAADRVRDAIQSRDPEFIYKKVDSTLRGNLGAEIRAAMLQTGINTSIVAPAFPANQRITAGGYHFVNGTLITNTEEGNDPNALVTSPRLPEYLRDQGLTSVEHLGIESLASGYPEEAINFGSIMTADALHESNLKALANTIAKLNEETLVVGSGGLAKHIQLADELKTDEEDPQCVDETSMSGGSPVVGIMGSIHPQAFSQIGKLDPEQVVLMDPTGVVRGEDAAVSDAVDSSLRKIQRGITVLLTSACSQDDVEKTISVAEEMDIDEITTRNRISSALADAAKQLWCTNAPSGIFLTGGATARSVLDSFNAKGIRLTGEEVKTGIPLGTVIGGCADETPIITKAGSFGSQLAIANCLKLLEECS